MTPTAQHPAGIQLPEGSYEIDRDDHRRFVAALGGARSTKVAVHPGYAYVAAQRGIGCDIRELLSLVDFDIEDGPLLTSCELELLQELELGRRYTVRGEVLSMERRSGRSTGPFDLLRVRQSIHLRSQPVAHVTNTFVLPRRATS